ncbi:MAG: CotY/CotZ family spore coat protein [Bacilli bacterium]
MCNNENKNCENCIADILKVIYILQQSVCPNDTCLESCDRGFLGQSCATICNTRPVMLYTCGSNGTPWTMPTTKTENGATSTVFRIEKLDGCCATFRVLEQNPNQESMYPYVATNSFFTMNLGCVCSLRCLDDTFVECI